MLILFASANNIRGNNLYFLRKFIRKGTDGCAAARYVSVKSAENRGIRRDDFAAGPSEIEGAQASFSGELKKALAQRPEIPEVKIAQFLFRSKPVDAYGEFLAPKFDVGAQGNVRYRAQNMAAGVAQRKVIIRAVRKIGSAPVPDRNSRKFRLSPELADGKAEQRPYKRAAGYGASARDFCT